MTYYTQFTCKQAIANMYVCHRKCRIIRGQAKDRRKIGKEKKILVFLVINVLEQWEIYQLRTTQTGSMPKVLLAQYFYGIKPLIGQTLLHCKVGQTPSRMLAFYICLIGLVCVTGHPSFRDKIPNGYAVFNPCGSTFWQAVGHYDPDHHTMEKNPFGLV